MGDGELEKVWGWPLRLGNHAGQNKTSKEAAFEGQHRAGLAAKESVLRSHCATTEPGYADKHFTCIWSVGW